ncbi:carotene hydroxylase [Flavobacterium franklandianum]|uniref:Carotene hydroxylase n=1 Tax=Flavobacterium franklandianum TaxID=2594430 RepID=A0A553CRE7_9FLAO|nr:sterol desaturase family protein [Flavobacterium franklandianum]TRX23031.1 carotene hydroxylase [Flavobacterium franklandianum]TRX27598.1 carotene hydroxylase [Flavobacterium franklandianum]
MISFLIFLATYLIMECITWCTHKFVMHGFLWYLHADHHQPKYAHIFERNDLFFVIFAIPSILLFYFGASAGFDYRFFIGLGIFAYGLSYFIVHDIFIHQRFKLFKNTKNKYLIALRKGHKVHHKHLGKEYGECFGMLFVPFKYFKI